jgi:hypothetical protein
MRRRAWGDRTQLPPILGARCGVMHPKGACPCGSRPATACFPRSWPGSGACPHPPDPCTLSPGSPPSSMARQPRPAERASKPRTRAPTPGPPVCPLPGILAHQDHLRGRQSADRAIRGIGSDRRTRAGRGVWGTCVDVTQIVQFGAPLSSCLDAFSIDHMFCGLEARRIA